MAAAEPVIHFIKNGPAGKHGEVTYAVFRGGDLLGYVERTASESWRKPGSGRIRTSMRGYDRKWHAIVPQGEGRGRWQMNRYVYETGFGQDKQLALASNGNGVGYWTRREAVEMLVAWADEPERRE